MDSSRFKVFAILGLAFAFALYLGVAAATAQIEAVAWVVGGVFAAVCLLLGKHVWILIPATLSLRGGINFLPGMIPPWVLMTMVTGAFFCARVALRRQTLTFRWTWMETAILIVGLTILQAMVRNPVGLRVLGGDSAGGKPYVVFAFAFAAYYLIIASRPEMKMWKWAVILFMVCGIGDGLIQALSALSPGFAQVMVKIYSNVSFDEAMGQGEGYQLGERRFGFLGQIGSILGLIACSYWRPVAALDFTKPWRGVTAGLGVICVLLSGFRGSSLSLFIRFCVGSAIRRKTIDVVLIVMVGLAGVAVIAISDIGTKLPFGVQRVLTAVPFPMRLDPRAESQAHHSSEDRFEMWRLALGSDKYIDNKVLGDGFQFSATEINAMSEAKLPGSYLTSLSWMEQSIAVGNYHGFHVETIRFTGAVGLIAATVLLLVFARFAWRAIQLHRDTVAWGHVIFICMPFLIHPFWYWLIFGSYRTGFPELVATGAMVKVAYELGCHAVNTNVSGGHGDQKVEVRALARRQTVGAPS